MEIILAKKILDLEPMELSKILMQLKLEHQEVFEKLEELVEDVV